MKKISAYTRYYKFEDLHILYNMLSDYIIVLEQSTFDVFYDNRYSLSTVEHKAPVLYSLLVKYNLIVDGDVDEPEALISQWQQSDAHPKYVKITILPTLQCNLRCWYCYEDHNNTSILSQDVAVGILNLIKRIANSDIIKINLDFFGGEPLMFFSETVEPIIAEAASVCKKQNKRLGISFTTNGTLLTDHVCNVLATTGADVSFQITLDGDRERHNKVRYLSGRTPTYDVIVSNIKRAVRTGFYVSIRFNYTHTNYNSYVRVLKDFADLSDGEKRLVDFSFHKVWQEQISPEISSSITETMNRYNNDGYTVNLPASLGCSERCYADIPNNIVINYNGDIYKCTARDFKQESREGVLQPNGTIIWNDRFSRRLKLIYGISFCHRCEIFPLCNFGCSQNRLELPDKVNHCPFGYSNIQKENIVRNRVYTLLYRYLNISTIQ